MSIDVTARLASLPHPTRYLYGEVLFASVNDEEPNTNYELLVSALDRPGVSALGWTPWVELSLAQAHENIAWILALAQERDVGADFHLSYTFDMRMQPIFWEIRCQMRGLGSKNSAAECRWVTTWAYNQAWAVLSR